MIFARCKLCYFDLYLASSLSELHVKTSFEIDINVQFISITILIY